MIQPAPPWKLKDIAQARPVYHLALALFLVLAIGGLALLDKGDAIWFFARNRTPFWNVFFREGTKIGEEPAYLAVFLALLFVRYRSGIIVPLIGIIVTLVAFILKSLFRALRPLAYFRELGLDNELTFVAGVHVNTAATSFPSGHTMSAFALFTFLVLIVGQKTVWQLLFFGLALVVAISRIYLVQHFLIDVLAGAIVGWLLGIAAYFAQFWLGRSPHRWLDRSLFDWRRGRQPAATVSPAENKP